MRFLTSRSYGTAGLKPTLLAGKPEAPPPDHRQESRSKVFDVFPNPVEQKPGSSQNVEGSDNQQGPHLQREDSVSGTEGKVVYQGSDEQKEAGVG